MSTVSNSRKKSGENTSTPAVKKRSSVKPTATAYLQVFGSGGGDTSPSVFLFADSQRYVFSCGEATQRLFHEQKLKLGKINNLFLTQLTWQCIGGLPGLLLTLREACKQSLSIHGPPGLSNFLTASQCFMSMHNVDLKCLEYDGASDGIYKDENIVVKPIPIKGESKDNFSYDSKMTEILDDEGCAVNNIEYSRSQSNIDCSKSDDYVNTKTPKRLKLDVEARTVVNYICELVAVPGKMNVKKAFELGVPKGPLLGKLQKGQDVTLDNGTVVKAEDVMEKSIGGSVFCIIDCPSEHYLKKLQHELEPHEEGDGKSTAVIIIHLSPAQMVQTQAYQDWTKRFGDLCQHLFLNSEMCPSKVAMFSQMGIQYCLHQLNPEIFPKLFASDEAEIETQKPGKDNWTAGEPYLVYHLRPTTQTGYDYTDIAKKWDMLVEKVHERERQMRPTETITNSEIKDALKYFINPKEFLCKTDNKHKLSFKTSSNIFAKDFQDMNKEFSVVFLGTGASLPSKYRNVSCTLVNISTEKLMLLDCGEGSYGQIYRHYGPNLDDILRKLCCIFISHIHADHHLGLVRVLQAWEKSMRSLPPEKQPDPIVIIGPPSLLEWLRYFGNFCETLTFRFYDPCKFRADCKNRLEDGILSSLLEAKVTIVPVIHCPCAFGLVLTHKNGWKVVYSGDTRPCYSLVEEGVNATVLIHEATLEDNLHTEALAKQHSTTSEAIQCGQDMGAKFTLLTHFSQRYPKIPVFNEEFNDCIGIAFDHMQVNFQNLSALPKLLQPLHKIFKEELEEQNVQCKFQDCHKTS